jgi:hypothetical protein
MAARDLEADRVVSYILMKAVKDRNGSQAQDAIYIEDCPRTHCDASYKGPFNQTICIGQF